MPVAAAPPACSTSSLFDPHGRLVPLGGEVVYSHVDRRYFSLAQPELDFPSIHAAVVKHLPASRLEERLPPAEFEHRCMAARAALSADVLTSRLFDGVHIPFLLPPSPPGDMVVELEQTLLPAVGRAYEAKMPGFSFCNHAAGQIVGGLRPAAGARYERILEKHASESIVGWYFPIALAGFAVPEQRRAIARLPEPLILAGPLEAAAAFVGVPDILMRVDNYPNLLALSAVEPTDPKFFHFFEAYGWNLTYNLRSMIGPVSEYFAGGLVVMA